MMKRAGTSTVTLCFLTTLMAICAASAAPAAAVHGGDHPQPQSGAFVTPLTNALIDLHSAAEWVDGSERPLQNPAGLRQIVWTQTLAPTTGAFLEFGKSNQPGIRHLR